MFNCHYNYFNLIKISCAKNTLWGAGIYEDVQDEQVNLCDKSKNSIM